MGNSCCTNLDKLSDSDAENLYREVLGLFPKLSYIELLDELDKCKIVSNIEDEARFSEVFYNKFRHNFSLKTKFPLIHIDLIPNWQEAWKIIYEEDFLANMLIWSFCFNKDHLEVKYQILDELCIMTDCSLEINFFKDFISRYLNLALIKLNHMYLTSLKKISKESKIITICQKQIDWELVKESEEIYSKISNKLMFNKFIEEMEYGIHKIFIKESDIDFNKSKFDGTFTKEMFLEFYNQFNFIFNIASLRGVYYNFIFKGISIVDIRNEKI
jgi:hypothetical protein